MYDLEKTPILFAPFNFNLFSDIFDSNVKFLWIFLIFKKYLNSSFLINNLNSFKNFFFLQNIYTKAAKSSFSSIKIKNRKNFYLKSFLFKSKKYLFFSSFRSIYLTKFKFFKKINKIKNNNTLKYSKTFFFNFYKTPHLSFFYKKFYPLTGFFLNSLSIPSISFFSETGDSLFSDDRDNLFSVKKIKIKKIIKKKKRSFFKSVKVRYFKKLLLNDSFYISKKNYFWNFFFNKKNIKVNQTTASLSNFSDLPHSKASLALSLNFKKNSYDLDKLVLFSSELLLSSFLNLRSLFLKKKRYFRKSSTPYNPQLISGSKVFLPNFKKKSFKFKPISNFFFKKSPLFNNILGRVAGLSNALTNSKPKFLLITLRNSLKKKNRRLFNKILKKKNKFSKIYVFRYKNKNLYSKLNLQFLKSKYKFFFRKKKFLIKKNNRLIRFFNFFFVSFFFKNLKLRKKLFIFRLSKYRKKSLRKKFKRFMNYLKMKRKSPSATRRSKRILKRKFKLISLRVLKGNPLKFKFFKLSLPFVFKKNLYFSIIFKPINYFFLIYKLKTFQQKKKIKFFKYTT